MKAMKNNEKKKLHYDAISSMGLVLAEMSSWTAFNMASRDEDNIVDKIYRELNCSDFYYDDFKFL